MPSKCRRLTTGALALVAMAVPVEAWSQQKSAENAVTSADDAFGTSVGLESTGLYSQNNVRAFSPLDAGNARLDGIYFDPVANVSFRIRASQAERVGFAALQYPFPAPTGIVDDRLRTVQGEFTAGLGLHITQYGGYVTELDMQIPVVPERVGLVAGVAQGHSKQLDGGHSENYSFALKPVLRFATVEISPFISGSFVRYGDTKPYIVVRGNNVPDPPQRNRQYASFWAQNDTNNFNLGTTVKARLTDRLSLRAGLFRSSIRRNENYTELFMVSDRTGNARHIVIADPVQDLYSWSGEAQLAYRFGSGAWHHRLIAGFRGRDRYTESGGSDIEPLEDVTFGEPGPELKPDFVFSAVNRGKVRQTAWLLGYLGKWEGVAQLNLGLQRADFRARQTDGPDVTRSHQKEWLYNASIGIDLARDLILFGGTQRGLEDSGAAPETAANRNEQLPAARSTQYEVGLRWKLPAGQVVLSGFEITKPYFSFDAVDRYTRLGTEKHRGIEVSLSGHLVHDRLSLLAGAVFMKAEVSGPGVESGLIGDRAVGTRPPVKLSFDANYRTDLWGGFTPTLGVTIRGRSVAGARPLSPEPGSKQLMLPARNDVDLGFRQPLMLGRYPATVRAKVQNLLDQKRWIAIASQTFIPGDRRRFSASLLVDF
ncbi:MAG: TonB-dependent receptor [Novosphingobium sp.]|nr:TonB-dependent receptor [Novosphingobium sp.]